MVRKSEKKTQTAIEMISENLSGYEYFDEISTALISVERAGELLRNSFGRDNKVTSISGRDIKIQEDILSEKVIIDELTRFQYPILSEEIGSVGDVTSAAPLWIIDPLDGTHNYIRNIPICAVSIALWLDQRPILGIVNNFLANEIFVGIPEAGAWCNGNQITIGTIDNSSNASIATGFPINADFSSASVSKTINDAGRFKKIRMLGSAAMSLAYTASGRIDIYREENIMIWDIAGGLALVKAAGGSYILLPTPIQHCYSVIAGSRSIIEQYQSC